MSKSRGLRTAQRGNIVEGQSTATRSTLEFVEIFYFHKGSISEAGVSLSPDNDDDDGDDDAACF